MRLEKTESKSSYIRRRQIFDAYEKGLEYKSKVALESVSTENETKDWIKLDHEIIFKYFADKEMQTPQKNLFFCACKNCIFYFLAFV